MACFADDTVTLDEITYALSQEQKRLISDEWDHTCDRLGALFDEHDRDLEKRGLKGKVLDSGWIPGQGEILARFMGRRREIVTGEHLSEFTYQGVTVRMD